MVKKISPKTFVITTPTDRFYRDEIRENLYTENFIEEAIANYEKKNNCTESSRAISSVYDHFNGIIVYNITCTFVTNN